MRSARKAFPAAPPGRIGNGSRFMCRLWGSGISDVCRICQKRYNGMTKQEEESKPVLWVGSSRKDLRGFPKAVRIVCGQAIFDAQCGEKHPDAKPLKGFGDAGVLEVVEDH